MHPVQSNSFKCQKWFSSVLSDLVFLSLRWSSIWSFPGKLFLQDLYAKLSSSLLIIWPNQFSLLFLTWVIMSVFTSDYLSDIFPAMTLRQLFLILRAFVCPLFSMSMLHKHKLLFKC